MAEDLFGGYGVSDAKREKTVKWIVIGLLSTLIIGGFLYYRFKDFREERQVSQFLEFLSARNYPQAHALWGCTPQKPCRDYNFEKFMEDWGPNSPHAAAAQAKVLDVRACPSGIIATLGFPAHQTQLWVDRSDKAISFAPWSYQVPSGVSGFLSQTLGRAGMLSCSPSGS